MVWTSHCKEDGSVIKVSDSAEEAIRNALKEHADGGTVRVYIAGVG